MTIAEESAKNLFSLIFIGIFALFSFSGTACSLEPDRWPESIMLKCGDMISRLDKRKAWNINRIEYCGFRIGVDRSASHYGSVFRYPKIGFIGTGHTENQTEEVKSLKINVDGQYVDVTNEISGKSIVIEKTSRILDTILTRKTTITSDTIEEYVSLDNSKEQKLSLFYPFMFPLIDSCTDYAAGNADGITKSGKYNTERDFPVDDKVKWVGVFHEDKKIGAVATIIEYPELAGFQWTLWNVPGTYKKVYAKSFIKKTLPAGFKGDYHIKLQIFSSDSERWQEKALSLVQKN